MNSDIIITFLKKRCSVVVMRDNETGNGEKTTFKGVVTSDGNYTSPSRVDIVDEIKGKAVNVLVDDIESIEVIRED